MKKPLYFINMSEIIIIYLLKLLQLTDRNKGLAGMRKRDGYFPPLAFRSAIQFASGEGIGPDIDPTGTPVSKA